MRLEVSQSVAAPPQVVWDVLVSWEQQPEWMLDAKDVEVVTPYREGEGVTIRVPTNLLGVTVEDVMRVTAWREPELLEVEHLGRLIRGSGAFKLQPEEHGRTRLVWDERIVPPLGRLGEWGASTLVEPIIRRIFQRSLRNLAGLAEDEAARRGAP